MITAVRHNCIALSEQTGVPSQVAAIKEWDVTDRISGVTEITAGAADDWREGYGVNSEVIAPRRSRLTISLGSNKTHRHGHRHAPQPRK